MEVASAGIERRIYKNHCFGLSGFPSGAITAKGVVCSRSRNGRTRFTWSVDGNLSISGR